MVKKTKQKSKQKIKKNKKYGKGPEERLKAKLAREQASSLRKQERETRKQERVKVNETRKQERIKTNELSKLNKEQLYSIVKYVFVIRRYFNNSNIKSRIKANFMSKFSKYEEILTQEETMLENLDLPTHIKISDEHKKILDVLLNKIIKSKSIDNETIKNIKLVFKIQELYNVTLQELQTYYNKTGFTFNNEQRDFIYKLVTGEDLDLRESSMSDYESDEEERLSPREALTKSLSKMQAQGKKSRKKRKSHNKRSHHKKRKSH